MILLTAKCVFFLGHFSSSWESHPARFRRFWMFGISCSALQSGTAEQGKVVGSQWAIITAQSRAVTIMDVSDYTLLYMLRVTCTALWELHVPGTRGSSWAQKELFQCASGSWTPQWVLTYLLQETSFKSVLIWVQSWRHLDLLYSIMAEKCLPAPTGERQGFRLGTGNWNMNDGVAEGLWRSGTRLLYGCASEGAACSRGVF